MSKKHPDKQRLDIAVFERRLAHSREKARGMVMAGEVLVNGSVVDKPGTRVSSTDQITLIDRPRYVSRGGDKLAGALRDFNYSPSGMVCADVGASTGGFTDCLLQHSASKVYAIDVGYGQLAYPLRQDERVIVMERTNARYIVDLPEKPDLVVVDASFISLRILLPVIQGWLHAKSSVVALIKPQFEAGKAEIGKGGVVRSKRIRKEVLSNIAEFISSKSLYIYGITASQLKGPAGNIEYFIHLGLDKQLCLPEETIAQTIERLTNDA